MKYLTFEDIEISLTRRCNMDCPHCYKGNSENVDLTKDDIDALISQTEMIGNLYLTGGEPTLRLDLMSYLLERVEAEDIPVFKLVVVSNGLTNADAVSDVMKSWAKYIRQSNKDYKGLDSTSNGFVELRISRDKFHSHSDFVEKQIVRYRQMLNGIVTVNISASGQTPVYKGKAIANLNKKDCRIEAEERQSKMQIVILDKDHKPECVRYKTYRLCYPNQVIVCCAVYVTANGNLIRNDIGDQYEYTTEDDPANIVCNVHDDIYDNILKFNLNKKTCFQCMIEDKRLEEIDRIIRKHNHDYVMSHIDDMLYQSELIANNTELPYEKSISDELAAEIDNIDTIVSILTQMREESQQMEYYKEPNT